MINLESTKFGSLKLISQNVENIYDDMEKYRGVLSFGEIELRIEKYLEKISENVYTLLLGPKSLKSYAVNSTEVQDVSDGV